jgi:hypothetical protein
MSKTAKRQFVLVLSVDQRFRTDSTRLVGRFYHLAEDGGFRRTLGDRFEDGAEFADFEVSALVKAEYGVFGLSAEYRDVYSVDVFRAESMVKLLRKVNKGLERLNSERGWVDSNDFAGYALRVAEVLGVREFYVENGERESRISGQRERRTDGAGVQLWVQQRVREVLPERVEA